MRRPPIQLAAAALLAFGIAALLTADERGPGRAGHVMRCLERLDLSDSKKEAVRQVLESKKDALRARQEAIGDSRQRLRAAASTQTPDPAAVGAAYLEMDASREALREELGKIRSEIAGMLTPEQNAKLAGCLEAAPRGRRGARGR